MSLHDIQSTLLRAAEHIERSAEELRRSHTAPPEHRDWTDDKRAFTAWHDEAVLALHCRVAAKEIADLLRQWRGEDRDGNDTTAQGSLS